MKQVYTARIAVLALSIGGEVIGPATAQASETDPAVAAPAPLTRTLTAPLPARPTAVEFRSVADTDAADIGSLGAQLRRGYRYSDGRDWPAIISSPMTAPNGAGYRCTAALIGPQVLLTAAHCVPAANGVGFFVGGTKYTTDICVTPAEYPGDPSADFALCRITVPVVPPGMAFRFESVSVRAMDAQVGRRLLLVGYGCTGDVVGATGPNDGKFGYGFNRVDESSNAATPRRLAKGAEYATLYTPSERNNLFTPPVADDPAAANICVGDSGGPVFARPVGAPLTGVAQRRIIGVNARVLLDNPDATPQRYGESIFSATGGPLFNGWATKWLRDNQVVACGIDGGALPNCRS